MIRILHLVDSLEPGGMENGIVNVSVRLDPKEFDVHVCCLTQRGEFAERMPRPEQISSIGKESGFSLQWFTAVKQQIKRVEPDLLHTHNLGPLIYGSLASGFGRSLPILHGEHGQLDKHHLTTKRLWQRKFLYQTCKQVHTVSNSLRQDLIDCGFSAKKITAVTNGVDTDRFHPATDKKKSCQELNLPLSEDSKLLGIVGRFSEFKGHLLLLEAFEKLCIAGQDVHLLLIGGGGSEEKKVIARARNSMFAERIHAVGHQTDPERYYRAMDLMVFPSSHEGLSNAVLEAMACALPVLASKACGNDEAIINRVSGFLEIFESAEGLFQSIQKVLKDSTNLETVGMSARQHILKNFSIESMVCGYRQIYQDVLQ